MYWIQIVKVLLLLLVSIGIVTVVVLMGTGKYKSSTQIDTELWYIFGFSLMILIAIFMTNHLYINSEPRMKLNIEWALIYMSLILSYVSISYINIPSFGGSIASGAVSKLSTSAPLTGAGAPGTQGCCKV